MERHDLLDLMAQLKLPGMKAAYDEVLRDGIKRQRPVGDIPRVKPEGRLSAIC